MAKPFPILYSRTSKGQIQTWLITIDGGTFYTKEGIKGGTISESKPTICKPKNVGRANETTAELQAESEAQSKWQKKIDGGYFENEADIDNEVTFWPMLAEKWKDYQEDTTYPVFSQPKLDGMRCIVKREGMFSREGKPIVSAPHIHRLLMPIFETNPSLVIDGELYSNKFNKDFNKIISLAKKTKPTPENLAESEEKLEYWVYDFINLKCMDAKFEERLKEGSAAIKFLPDNRNKIRWVYTKLVKTETELNELFDKYIDNGFEGQMIRWNEAYQNKRTRFLLKRKDFIDDEYQLVNLEEGDGNRAGLATVAYFVMKDGKTFKAGVIGDNEYTADILKNKNKLIGKMVTVCYFQLTPDGIPRFAKMKAVRDYE